MHAAARAHDVDEQRRRQRAADMIDERLVHIGAGRPQMLGQPGAQPQRRLDHVI
ncbi:putative siderophore non-ribosomal peptide synthase domain protein [Burkholderia mallei]|nr:putative siderophore non-ribosomal peptide synthase domain protein [Burkholderia mallei]